mmetsp:Transcript_27448/g.91291  ORF Transcript_27448/g.91291 Transcript_27448/m.91291 type:complete len:250 (-) Transcript_27448:654-1403(-)
MELSDPRVIGALLLPGPHASPHYVVGRAQPRPVPRRSPHASSLARNIVLHPGRHCGRNVDCLGSFGRRSRDRLCRALRSHPLLAGDVAQHGPRIACASLRVAGAAAGGRCSLDSECPFQGARARAPQGNADNLPLLFCPAHRDAGGAPGGGDHISRVRAARHPLLDSLVRGGFLCPDAAARCGVALFVARPSAEEPIDGVHRSLPRRPCESLPDSSRRECPRGSQRGASKPSFSPCGTPQRARRGAGGR